MMSLYVCTSLLVFHASRAVRRATVGRPWWSDAHILSDGSSCQSRAELRVQDVRFGLGRPWRPRETSRAAKSGSESYDELKYSTCRRTRHYRPTPPTLSDATSSVHLSLLPVAVITISRQPAETTCGISCRCEQSIIFPRSLSKRYVHACSVLELFCSCVLSDPLRKKIVF